MLMPDPASGLQELERLLELSCGDWVPRLAPQGVEVDCEGVAAGQQALRAALVEGGTYHDVLGRLRHGLDVSGLAARARRSALAVADVARAAPRRQLAAAVAAQNH